MKPDFKNNIKISYLYRDEDNYKLFGSVIFANPEQLPIMEIKQIIKDSLIDSDFFYPSEWKIPLFNELVYEVPTPWYELEKVEITNEKSNTDRSIQEFLNNIRKENIE